MRSGNADGCKPPGTFSFSIFLPSYGTSPAACYGERGRQCS